MTRTRVLIASPLEAELAALIQEAEPRAEVLNGVPGDTAEGLADAVTSLPGLRWVHATSAGAGEQVRKAALPPEALERVAITTSSGVHAVPLAEFAVLGLL